MKEYYLANKILSFFQVKKKNGVDQEYKMQLAKIANNLNFEIERELKELNYRLCGYVNYLLEKQCNK